MNQPLSELARLKQKHDDAMSELKAQQLIEIDEYIRLLLKQKVVTDAYNSMKK